MVAELPITRCSRVKFGGLVVVARRAVKNFAFAQPTYWFQILRFFITGSTNWNVAIGREKGEVQQYEEGMKTAWNFGKNMAFLTKKEGEETSYFVIWCNTVRANKPSNIGIIIPGAVIVKVNADKSG